MRPITWILGIIIIIVLLVSGASLLDTPDKSNGNINEEPNQNDLIHVTLPVPNATATSPLTFEGEARGSWYFEADFPVRLLDGNGREIAIGIAQAQEDWMTTIFVPFSSVINFTNPTTTTGTLVFEKSNPSGLEEHRDEVRVPVKFEVANVPMRLVKLYYYKEANDKDTSGNILCSTKGLEIVERNIPFTNTPIQDAVKALIKGELNSSERSSGLSTEFPLTGLALQSASINNKVLTLTFSDPQNKTTGGSCRVSILRAQIDATGRQFGGVNEVRFAPSGVFEP